MEVACTSDLSNRGEISLIGDRGLMGDLGLDGESDLAVAVMAGSFVGDVDLDLDLSRNFFNNARRFSGGLSGGEDSK